MLQDHCQAIPNGIAATKTGTAALGIPSRKPSRPSAQAPSPSRAPPIPESARGRTRSRTATAGLQRPEPTSTVIPCLMPTPAISSATPKRLAARANAPVPLGPRARATTMLVTAPRATTATWAAVAAIAPPPRCRSPGSGGAAASSVWGSCTRRSVPSASPDLACSRPMSTQTDIPLFATKAAVEPLLGEVAERQRAVIESGRYILGPEVEAFEAEFASYLGAKHCIGVANGTEAITIALRAAGVGPGDEVIVPALT